MPMMSQEDKTTRWPELVRPGQGAPCSETHRGRAVPAPSPRLASRAQPLLGLQQPPHPAGQLQSVKCAWPWTLRSGLGKSDDLARREPGPSGVAGRERGPESTPPFLLVGLQQPQALGSLHICVDLPTPRPQVRVNHSSPPVISVHFSPLCPHPGGDGVLSAWDTAVRPASSSHSSKGLLEAVYTQGVESGCMGHPHTSLPRAPGSHRASPGTDHLETVCEGRQSSGWGSAPPSVCHGLPRSACLASGSLQGAWTRRSPAVTSPLLMSTGEGFQGLFISLLAPSLCLGTVSPRPNSHVPRPGDRTPSPRSPPHRLNSLCTDPGPEDPEPRQDTLEGSPAQVRMGWLSLPAPSWLPSVSRWVPHHPSIPQPLRCTCCTHGLLCEGGGRAMQPAPTSPAPPAPLLHPRPPLTLRE